MTHYWEKLGQLFWPDPKNYKLHPKLLTHAANPLAFHLHDDVFRVFYSGRDGRNRSSVGGVDIDIVKRKVIKYYEEPFFQHGKPGTFYADGVSIGCSYAVNQTKYILFMGWQNPRDKHWRGDIGRLVVNSDLSLSLESEIPHLGCNEIDPISLSYPWVEPSGNGGFDMWYGSTKSWDAGNGEMIHTINHAYSVDGHTWERKGLAIPFEKGNFQAFSRPTVLRRDSSYNMWFSYRSGSGEKYRIGYAQSNDAISWSTDLIKNAGIDISASGWDSEMIEYPYAFNHKESTYMLYNGNNFGITGFGLALYSKN